MLERHPSPLMLDAHSVAVRLSDERDAALAEKRTSLTCGRRQFGSPMMALQAKKSLGPCRHALTQMVVAGSMVVNPPVQIRIEVASAT
jgi:hypothetical protein